MGLLVILLVAIFDFMIGAVIGPQSDLVRAQGFVGWNGLYYYIFINYKYDYFVQKGIESVKNVPLLKLFNTTDIQGDPKENIFNLSFMVY